MLTDPVSFFLLVLYLDELLACRFEYQLDSRFMASALVLLTNQLL